MASSYTDDAPVGSLFKFSACVLLAAMVTLVAAPIAAVIRRDAREQRRRHDARAEE